MDERERREALYRFKDGEISPDEAADIERHLAECRECRQAADVLHAVRTHIAAWPKPAAADDMAERVLERIRGQAARVLSLKSHLRLTAAAAAVLLVASLAAIPFFPRSAEAPPVDSIADVALDTMMTELAEEYQPDVNGEGEGR
jgi:anti-sigma factor RsiW